MIRIYKPEARKRFRDGEKIAVLPCKVRFENAWIRPMIISQTAFPDDPFDRIIREYEYYNCNAELGYYAAFYIEN